MSHKNNIHQSFIYLKALAKENVLILFLSQAVPQTLGFFNHTPMNG